MIRVQKICMLGLTLIALWTVARRSYFYFFDVCPPAVCVKGICENAYYAGTIEGLVRSDKKGTVSLLIDDIVLVQDVSLKQNIEHPFTISTEKLQSGKHVLKICCFDATYRQNKIIMELPFFVDNQPLHVDFVKQERFSVLPGRTLYVKFQVNKEIAKAQIKALAASYDCFPDQHVSSIYEGCIPISCEEKPQEYLFSVRVADKVGNIVTLDNKFTVAI